MDELLRKKLAQLDATLAKDDEEEEDKMTTTATREKLAELERKLEARSLGTSTGTREKFFSEDERELATSTLTREKRAEIERKLVARSLSTSTGTREKLAEDERKLETSMVTREKLAEVERKLSERSSGTSTGTREKLATAERKLATSVVTREKLAEVERKLLERSLGTSSGTREKLAKAERELATSTATREKLAEVERKLAKRSLSTSTGTREKLAEAERKLATSTVTREKLAEVEKKLVERSLGTSTGTREKLAKAERKLATSTVTRENLAELERKLAARSLGTSTGTREKLAEAERKLAISAGTREKLADAEKRLEKLNTSTKTREKLHKVEAEILRYRQKEISNHTMEVFKYKQKILEEMLEKNKNVDVAFMLDCTGSMSSFINEAKNQINKIVTEITESYDNEVRVAFVGYRDHSDGTNRIETLAFTEDPSEFTRFLSSVSADGGGDAPEDVLGGLEAVINLAWSSASKVIFHIGDAPQHGERFHDFGAHADSYYEVEPRGLVPEDLFRSMKQIGITYFFGKVNDSTDKMFRAFQVLGGPEGVKEADMSRPDQLAIQAVTSITSTIEKTLSTSVTFAKIMATAKHATNLSAISEESEGSKTLKNYAISEMGHDDSRLVLEPQKEVYWLNCVLGGTGNVTPENIKQHIGTIDQKWSQTMMKKAKHPFAEGAQRISYHGQIMNYSDRVDQKIVLKEFKHFGTGRDRRADYIEIMETQCVAAYFASEFNKVAPPASKKISFLTVINIYSFREPNEFFRLLLGHPKGRPLQECPSLWCLMSVIIV